MRTTSGFERFLCVSSDALRRMINRCLFFSLELAHRVRDSTEDICVRSRCVNDAKPSDNRIRLLN